MDIVAHIRELLFGHDCVIVPGFGGFIGNYTPARIDKATSTFHPPVKQISFNRNLNHNDGLLIGRISESSGLNYGDARNLADQFAADITRRLGRGEKVVFDHIGTFTHNQEGNIQFEPDNGSNYHLNSYGLTSFQFYPLEGYDVRRRIIRHDGSEPVKNHSLRKYLWRAAVIIPLLGVLVAVPLTTDIFRTKVQSTNLNPLASVEFDSNREAVVNKPEIKMEVLPETGIEQPEPLPVYNYCVITGSFRSESNAGVLMGQLAGEGYTPELLAGPNGFYRVSAVKCQTLEEAVQKKEAIGLKYKGSWVARIN